MRKRTITVTQYTNEIKLMSLVPDHIKKVKLRESFITEIEYIKSRSNKMTVEQKALAVTKALKKSLSELQWEAAKRMLATDDLSEGEFGNKRISQQRTFRYKIRYSKMDISFLGRSIIHHNRHRSDANQKIIH